jgi:zinc protease
VRVSKILAASALLVVALTPVRPASAQQAAPQAAAGGVLPHSLQVDKLDNGLTVVTVPFDSPGIVAYYTLVQAGSRDEVEPGKSGYAHLFEHLMFRGTDSVPAEEYERQLQRLGADDNAFTTDDVTLYNTTLPAESLGDLIKLNADRFQHLHYLPEKYKDETGAVLGERNKVFSNPEAAMEEALRGIEFKQHTYGHTTIGSKHDVEDMPNQYEYSRVFFRRFYTPDDCVIFVVGDFDRGKALAAIKDAYGGWRGTRAKTNAKAEPEQKAPRAKALTWKGETDPRLAIAYRTPAMGGTSAAESRRGQHKDTSLADCAALATLEAAAFGEPSDLYQRLVVQEQKVLDLDFDPRAVQSKDPGSLEIDATLKATTSFDEIIGAVQGALDAAASGRLAPEKILAARDHILNGMILRAQTPGQVATLVALATGALGDPHGFERYAAALAAVTPEDVARVAKLLKPAHRSVVTLVSEANAAPDGKKPAAGGGK